MLPAPIEIVPPSQPIESTVVLPGLEELDQSRPGTRSTCERSRSLARCPLERGNTDDGELSQVAGKAVLVRQLMIARGPGRSACSSKLRPAADRRRGHRVRCLEVFRTNWRTTVGSTPK